MQVIWLNSGHEPPPQRVLGDPRIRVVDQADLTAADLRHASGLITGMLLDQNAFLALSPALEAFLDAGGRWFINGHILRNFVHGLQSFRPIPHPKRADFTHHRPITHPIFDGIAAEKLETNKGVAGFYGRGENPMPSGAMALTLIAQGTMAVDWLWLRPQGGRIISHAGNDLHECGREWGLDDVLLARIIDWTAGGKCLCA